MWRFGIPVLIILTLLPLAACAVFAFILPDTVPLHIGFDGTVNRWGSKWELLAVMGIASLVCNGVFTLCYVYAPQLKSMGLLNGPKNNDVGIARWILIGSAVFVDAVIIGCTAWAASIALGAA